MLTISLPFLDSSEIISFMVFFYNVLVQFLKHQYNKLMGATTVYICLFIQCRTSGSLQKPIESIPGTHFALVLIAILIILYLKIFIHQFV